MRAYTQGLALMGGKNGFDARGEWETAEDDVGGVV